MNPDELTELLTANVPPECPDCGYGLDYISFSREGIGHGLYLASCPACGEDLYDEFFE